MGLSVPSSEGQAFPAGFLWGAATSAHQVEGNNRTSDWWEHEEAGRLPHRSGEACRHYDLYEQDFDLARALGHNAHRCSLEWSRVEPREGVWDPSAVAHYRAVIASLRGKGLEPVVTLHHFTNPAWFARRGGWLRRDSVRLFKRFVDHVVPQLPEVRYWLTINEPLVYAKYTYVSGTWALPARSWRRAALALHHLARAHRAAYRSIHATGRDVLVGLAHSAPWIVPCNERRIADRMAATVRDLLLNRAFFHAIGPDLRLRRAGRRYLDFLGLNYYSRTVVRWAPSGQAALFGEECLEDHHGAARTFSDMGWEIHPPGLLAVLEKFAGLGVPLMVTENGIATENEELRRRFLTQHLQALAQAVARGIPLLGYFYWSLIDNYEWAFGTAPKFGLAAVDFRTQIRNAPADGMGVRGSVQEQSPPNRLCALTIIDARRLESGTELLTDVCVIGGGAAGITIAVKLANSPLHVHLVESGGFTPDAETQALSHLDNAGYPIRENFMSRARYLGGSCNLWAGRSMVLRETDLEPRPWVANSGWPVRHAELARYYANAVGVLKLPAMEVFTPDAHAETLSDDERRLFADGQLAPTVSLWAKRPMRFARQYRATLRSARNIRVLTHANATSVQLDMEGTSVRYANVATLTGKTFRVRARTFVLAAGGLENARLLLVSRDVHAAGIGNAFDVLGRYFMDHPRAVHGRVHLRPDCRLRMLRGKPLVNGRVQVGLGISAETQRREGLLNHYATLEAEVSGYTQARYQSFVQTMKVLLRRGWAGSRLDVRSAPLGKIPNLIYLLTPKELLPHFLLRWHHALRTATEPRRARRYVVVYFCEQPPDPESRVILSQERDPLGVNKLTLHWRIGSEVTHTVNRLEELLRDRFEATGIGQLEAAAEGVRYTDASHHMGTTRMSDDPRRGVVDRDCRVHGVANLYVAGSSVFPNAGHANPTLTIVALACRLADHLRTVTPALAKHPGASENNAT